MILVTGATGNIGTELANGVPEILVESLAEIWKRIRAGGGTFQTNEVERLTGQQAQTFETWCDQHRSAFL